LTPQIFANTQTNRGGRRREGEYNSNDITHSTTTRRRNNPHLGRARIRRRRGGEKKEDRGGEEGEGERKQRKDT